MFDDTPIVAVLQSSAVCFFPTTQAILGAEVLLFRAAGAVHVFSGVLVARGLVTPCRGGNITKTALTFAIHRFIRADLFGPGCI